MFKVRLTPGIPPPPGTGFIIGYIPSPPDPDESIHGRRHKQWQLIKFISK